MGAPGFAHRSGQGTAMRRDGMGVHCLSRLDAASAGLAIELCCVDGVFTQWAVTLSKARSSL